jgi:hypothetical protein
MATVINYFSTIVSYGRKIFVAFGPFVEKTFRLTDRQISLGTSKQSLNKTSGLYYKSFTIVYYNHKVRSKLWRHLLMMQES